MGEGRGIFSPQSWPPERENWADLIAQLVKNLPAMQETLVGFLVEMLWRRDRIPTPVFLGFPCGSAGNLPTMWEDWVGKPEDPLEKGKVTLQYSGLENSMDCIVHGVGHDWVTFIFLSLFVLWARWWIPKAKTSSWFFFLPSFMPVSIIISSSCSPQDIHSCWKYCNRKSLLFLKNNSSTMENIGQLLSILMQSEWQKKLWKKDTKFGIYMIFPLKIHRKCEDVCT